MKLAGLSKRERYILYICVTVIASSLLYNFVLEPAVRRWRSLGKEILVQRAKLEKNLKVIAREESARREYERYAGYIEQKGSDEEEMALLLREIEMLASNSGVRITDIKPRPVKDMKFYKKYTIEVESESEIRSLTRFVYQLQKSKQLLKVQRLRLTTKGRGSPILRSYMLITRVSAP